LAGLPGRSWSCLCEPLVRTLRVEFPEDWFAPIRGEGYVFVGQLRLNPAGPSMPMLSEPADAHGYIAPRLVGHGRLNE
jgi:hypothetical protein